MTKPLYELPDCVFVNGVSNGNCTPRLTPKYGNPFRGLLINGPKVVTWPKNDSPDNYMKGPFGNTMEGPFRAYVVVFYELPYATLNLDGDFDDDILIVAVNQKTYQVYKGKQRSHGFKPPKHEDISPEVIEAMRKNTTIGGDLGVSLIDDLGLPIANAAYTVYATLGEYKSNVLTLRTEVK